MITQTMWALASAQDIVSWLQTQRGGGGSTPILEGDREALHDIYIYTFSDPFGHQF